MRKVKRKKKMRKEMIVSFRPIIARGALRHHRRHSIIVGLLHYSRSTAVMFIRNKRLRKPQPRNIKIFQVKSKRLIRFNNKNNLSRRKLVKLTLLMTTEHNSFQFKFNQIIINIHHSRNQSLT